MPLFDPMPSWFAAEGEQNGMPLMIRGRQIEPDDIGRPDLPCLFVLTYRYEAEDDTGLPSEAQYEELEEFEGRIVEFVEDAGVGIATFVATCNGKVEYFFYVKDVTEASAVFNQQIDDNDPIEMAAKDDPEWTAYSAFLEGIGGLYD